MLLDFDFCNQLKSNKRPAGTAEAPAVPRCAQRTRSQFSWAVAVNNTLLVLVAYKSKVTHKLPPPNPVQQCKVWSK